MTGSGKTTQAAGSHDKASKQGKSHREDQIEFEIEFYQAILRRHADYVDVLRILGNNLTIKGRLREGLEIDRRLVRLRPTDYLAHYNLACTFALLGNPDEALAALRTSIELGYRDFSYMTQDRDLDSLRGDPRYRQLLAEFGHGRIVTNHAVTR